MKLYEFTYLIYPNLSREEINSLEDRINSFIKEGNGTIVKSSSVVKKTLAYPIKKIGEAFLANLIFNLEPEKVESLEKKIKSEKRIIRYLLLKKKVSKKVITPYRLRVKTKIETKPKVELEEIEKKLEEILGE